MYEDLSLEVDNLTECLILVICRYGKHGIGKSDRLLASNVAGEMFELTDYVRLTHGESWAIEPATVEVAALLAAVT